MARSPRADPPHRITAIVAFAATAAMGLIAVAGFSQVTADGRPIVAAATAVGVAAGTAAGVLLLRGGERVPAVLLLVSVITPTFFAAVVNLIPLVLGIALLAASFRTSRSPAPGATGPGTLTTG